MNQLQYTKIDDTKITFKNENSTATFDKVYIGSDKFVKFNLHIMHSDSTFSFTYSFKLEKFTKSIVLIKQLVKGLDCELEFNKVYSFVNEVTF